MSLEKRPKKHSALGLVKRTGIVLAILLIIVAIVWFILYLQRPQIHYSLKQADCSSAAITARNQTIGADLSSCVLVVSATNQKDRYEYIDYDSVGGGPIGKGDPSIRIYTTGNRFCFVALAGEGSAFVPHGTNNLTLRCADAAHTPANYDRASDTNPKYIEISGNYSKVRINVKPVR